MVVAHRTNVKLAPDPTRVLIRPFFPYGPEPYCSIGPIRRQVCEFLLTELLLWLVHSGQLDISQHPGRQRLSDFIAQARGP